MRIIFDFQPSSGRPPLDWRERVPAGFVIRRIDAEIAARYHAVLASLERPLWFDKEWDGIPNFVEQGFGFVAEWDGDGIPFIASNCRTCRTGMNLHGIEESIKDGVAHIQVSTRARFQKQGLATLVCAAFIEHCFERGFIPAYSCEEENLVSAALALKLGFVPVGKRESEMR